MSLTRTNWQFTVFSMSPIGRNRELFDRSTHQPLFHSVYRFELSLTYETRVISILLLITYLMPEFADELHMTFLHDCKSRSTNLTWEALQFSESICRGFHLLSIALARSPSRHCSVLFHFLSLAG